FTAIPLTPFATSPRGRASPAPQFVYPSHLSPLPSPMRQCLPDRRAVMDGSAAIEQNRMALKRIVAALIAMAGLDADREAWGERKTRFTLPRHLWLAVLRLLRPAEAAARRLIIAAARGLTITLPPPRKPAPRPVPPDQFLRRFGIAVTMPAVGVAAAARHSAAPARPRSYCLPLLDALRTPEPYGG